MNMRFGWRRLQAAVTTSVLIAWWQIRRSRSQLLLAGASIVIAMLLVVLSPLYVHQALEDGFERALARSNQQAINAQLQSNLTVTTTLSLPDLFGASDYAARDQAVRTTITQQVGRYLLPQSRQALQLSDIKINASASAGGLQALSLIGTKIDSLASSLTIVQGRLPNDQDRSLDAVITPPTAQALHLVVGSALTVPLPLPPLATTANGGNSQPPTIPIQIVGIAQLSPTSMSPFAQQYNYLQPARYVGTSGDVLTEYPVLVAQSAFFAALMPPAVMQALEIDDATVALWWVFQPDFSHFDVDHLGDISNRFAHLADTANQTLTADPTNMYTIASSLVGEDRPIQIYAAQVQVAAAPIIILLVDILGLLFFFITLMAELVIDGQLSTIAQLRMRGISRARILGGYLWLSFSLVLGALLMSGAVALMLGRFFVPDLMPGDVATGAGMQTIIRGLPYALLVASFSLVILWVTMGIGLQSDAMIVRRESGRVLHIPIWQRFHLDLALGFVLLVAFGISAYAMQTTTDPKTATQLAPLSLVAPTLLVIAGVLFLLRLLPWMFQQAALLAAANRGAVPFLACLQLARTPATILRLLLVFVLTVAFGVSSVVYASTQDARISDVAAQQVGADFSGEIGSQSLPLSPSLSAIYQRYAAIPGVTAVAAGYEDQGNPVVNANTSLINVIAIDAQAYQLAAIWPGATDPKTVRHLLQMLISHRVSSIAADTVPAIVDANTWNAFHLSAGALFHLNMTGYADTSSMRFVALGEVPTIPTVDVVQAGILTDLLTYDGVFQHDTALATPNPDMVWLRTQSDTASLRAVTMALASGGTALANYQNRYAIAAQIRSDPVAALILHILALGLIFPLLLSFIGNLIALWTQMQQQVTLLALARALGMSPAQVRHLLTWEMGLMQVIAVVFGCLFGVLLAMTLAPALVVTTTLPGNLATPLAVYVLQTALPIQWYSRRQL